MNRRKIINLPNVLSILRIALTPLILLCFFSDVWYWKCMAFIVFLCAALTDYFDGKIARVRNQITTTGRFLDPLADKILVTAALVAFALDRLVMWWLIVPIVARDLYVTAVRLRGLHNGKFLETSRLAKWKTATQLVVVIALLLLIGLLEGVKEVVGHQAIFLDDSQVYIFANVLMSIVLILTVLSGFHYAFRDDDR